MATTATAVAPVEVAQVDLMAAGRVAVGGWVVAFVVAAACAAMLPVVVLVAMVKVALAV